MRKIIITLITFCFFLFSFSTTSIALENKKVVSISVYDISSLSVEKFDLLSSIETSSLNQSIDQISPMVTGIYYEYVFVGRQSIVKKPIGYAYNQPINGVFFVGGTGSIYWVDNGATESFSVNIGYGPISISISPGSRSNVVSNYAAQCPANVSCKLYIYRDLSVTQYAVYKHQYGVRTFAYNTAVYTTTRIYLEPRTNF